MVISDDSNAHIMLISIYKSSTSEQDEQERARHMFHMKKAPENFPL